MDPELASLTQSAGATVVTLMASDAWQAARQRILELWRRVQPGRAEAALAALDTSREDALEAGATGDQQTLDELRSQWQGLFRRLLAAHPEAASHLRAILDEIQPPPGADAPAITQRATASGHARVYQAGRDQHIAEA